MFLHDPLQRAFLFAYMQRTYQIYQISNISNQGVTSSMIAQRDPFPSSDICIHPE